MEVFVASLGIVALSLGLAFAFEGPALFKQVPMPGHPPSIKRIPIMPDLIWLAVLAGLFLLTLAFVRLCDNA